MKNLCIFGLAAAVVLALAPGAAAHRLVPDDGTHTSAETAIFLDDVELSQVVYHAVRAESNQLWIAFDAPADGDIYWQLGIPRIAGLEDYRPTVVVLGPGLPAVDVPLDVPEGLGGLVVETDGLPGEAFNEPFTGTRSWIVREEDVTLEEPGRHYVVAYHPDGTPGKFWLAVGRREEFGFSDVVTYEDTLDVVREFHEVEDQRLPLLPRVLLALSRVAQTLCDMFTIG